MEKKQFENDKFILYSPDSLKFITDKMEDVLEKSFSLYEKIFDVKRFRKVQINYFDDKEKFRKFIYELRKEDKSLPTYAVGTFDNGMINAYINPNIEIGTDKYYKKIYLASHELFHIMYKELILQKYNINRITWFDEGMAQFFSGENTKKLSYKYYDEWVKKVIDETKQIPDLNNISHGSKFVNENYNGYDLSLIAVKYLYEFLGLEEFKKLMCNRLDINKRASIINDIFNSYNKGKNIKK